jgi:hypothetical protein
MALMNFLEVGARRGRVEGVEAGAEDGGISPGRGEPKREAAYYAN